jgi:tripartite-type tricarboxylate transporter receptor subunit TctC
MLRHGVLVATVAALVASPPARAQQDAAADYPNRPVKIIVSVPAGGGVDTVTRIFAAGLQQRLGQPFVIENRGGGGGNIGAEAAYVAEPDSPPSRRRSPATSRSTRSSTSIRSRSSRSPSCRNFPTCCWCGTIFRPRRCSTSSLT